MCLVSQKEQGHSVAPEECHEIGSAQLSVPCLQDSSSPSLIKLSFFQKYKKEDGALHHSL